MKTFVKKVTRDEKGAGVLALVLVLLVVGGLILTPLLGLMSTGLMAGQVYEKKTHELYSADAGVEDVIWRVLYEPIPSELWEASDLPDWDVYRYPEPLSVGNKSVEVVVYRKDRDLTPCRGDFTYRVLSTAVTDDASGTAGIESATTVEAYVEPLVFDLLSGALVSSGDISFHRDCIVTGDVYYVGEIIGKDYTHTEGEEIQIPPDVFPTQAENEAFADELKEEALEGGTYNGTGGNMNIDGSGDLGPIYVPGNLDISKDATINLKGVVYVKGHISCDNTLTITGNGSLVAEDYIYLSKLADYAVTGDSIIMSLNSYVTLKKSDKVGGLSINALVYAPNGTISFDKDMTVSGSVIGAGIQTDKDGSFTYIAKGNSFGLFEPVVYGAEIKTYTINPAV
jgi:hypothetical protein